MPTNTNKNKEHWKVSATGVDYEIRAVRSGLLIGTAHKHLESNGIDSKANAVLMAGGPTMVTELKFVIAALDEGISAELIKRSIEKTLKLVGE